MLAARRSPWREAAQMVSTSCAESRASGRSRRYALIGIFPVCASRHEATSNRRRASGEYDAHSETLTALRPSVTPRAMTHDRGATLGYRAHTVPFE